MNRLQKYYKVFHKATSNFTGKRGQRERGAERKKPCELFHIRTTE